ncbi:unnamed protein product [Dracunculus medinensis]|uniref:CX domain-containing protein n=1 Tax=Dracunculus medinensis TaxID=318479 RepID=A0A0N4U8Y5_DRAME|nr:unnamed protein product [Dracunculus medinensis]
MDLLIRPESKGIHYEGYDNEFIQCVFEDADISGRNERYEFRCRPDLECCGRLCSFYLAIFHSLLPFFKKFTRKFLKLLNGIKNK